MNNILTKKEAAKLLRISERTLDVLRKRGLPTRKFPGCGKCFFFQEELENWVEKISGTPTPKEQTEVEQ